MRIRTSWSHKFLLLFCSWIVLGSVHSWNLSFHRKTIKTAAADATPMPTTPAVEVPPSLDILSDMTQSNLQRVLDRVSETNAMLSKYFRIVYQCALNAILYKPPVGIVAIFGLHRIYTKLTKSPTTVQEINNQENSRTSGRKFYLDMDDADYNHHGGIDHVRAKLCRAALADRTEERVARALQVSHRPGDSRVRLVQELSSALSMPPHTAGDRTLMIAHTLLQVRAVDALLRIARDRLLKVSFRLQRTCDHYTHTLQAKKAYPKFLQDLFQSSIAADQARLSEATAAYQAELERLGRIAQILTERPGDMSQDYLIRALKEADDIKKRHKVERRQNSTTWARLSRIKLPNLGQYTLRWNVEGRGRFSLRKMESQGDIGAETAERTLLSDSSNAAWLRNADHWTRQARLTLGRILQEIHEDSVGEDESDDETMEQIRMEWSTQTVKVEATSDQALWLKALRVVDSLHAGRRIGEGKVLRLKDAALVHWTRQLDLYGIPSAILAVYIANKIHIRLTPHWPGFKKETLAVYATVLGIIRERFWFPLKSILDDLMNKTPTMMSAFGLDIEETSLDHMLRDLGYGDGSPQMRREGLKFASEQYEDALQNHLVGNLIRGKLVRLMLIQVQQLKVGVLSALETIDVLMKGNRIYFSVLAGIPAVVLATYGTKFLLHFMYNIRSRDLRPVKTVHAEMKELLLHTEELLLLAGQSRTGGGTSKLLLQPSELGQLLLTVHRYLILMDYSSPPFPAGQCDLIHENLRKMFGTDGILGRSLEDRQRTMWIQLVQKKHQELLKYI